MFAACSGRLPYTRETELKLLPARVQAPLHVFWPDFGMLARLELDTNAATKPNFVQIRACDVENGSSDDRSNSV